MSEFQPWRRFLGEKKKSCEIFPGLSFLGRSPSLGLGASSKQSVKKPADSKSRAFLPLVVNFASFLEGLTRSNPFFVEKKPGWKMAMAKEDFLPDDSTLKMLQEKFGQIPCKLSYLEICVKIWSFHFEEEEKQ